MKLIIDIPKYVYDLASKEDIIVDADIDKVTAAIKASKPYEESPVWHSLKDNPTDIPKQVDWYACKVKSSDDLCMVFGSSEITSDKYDAWLRIEHP